VIACTNLFAADATQPTASKPEHARKDFSAVVRERLFQPLYHSRPQAFWAYHFDLQAVPEYVHDEFGGIAVREFKLVSAVGQPLALLYRVPVFFGDLAGAGQAEAQSGDGLAWADCKGRLTFANDC
jgi:hypothetical protein